jgi:hypothetical protein
MRSLMLLALSAALLPPPALAETHRDPCPANGKTRGACPGYVVDHIKPLCAGGRDHPSNMQWQTRAEAKVKDREERKMCAGAKRH